MLLRKGGRIGDAEGEGEEEDDDDDDDEAVRIK